MSVSAVRAPSTVAAAEPICHPNQTSGRIHNAGETNQRGLFAMARKTPIKPAGIKNQGPHPGGHGCDHASAIEVGGENFESRMTGFPNFHKARPRSKPRSTAKPACGENPAGVL